MRDAPAFETIFFDLDGTLVDAFTTIHRAYCHTLPLLGFPKPSREEVRNAVGGGLETAMSHFVPKDLVAEACRIHVSYSEVILLDDPVLYPGAASLVRALRARGAVTAVLTNKIGDHARAVLNHLGLAEEFSLIIGARDTAFRKPDAAFTQEALRRLGRTPERCCLIGDSPFDVSTAQNAGFPSYCVTTGTHNREALVEAGADGVFPDLVQLGAAVFGV